MQKVFEELTVAFRKNSGKLEESEYIEIVTKHTTIAEDSETMFILLQASGYPIDYEDKNNRYILKTYFTPSHKQRYCVIDIETNGSKPDTSQVIEIGALIVEDGEIIDKFETFVSCTFLPDYITKITGIEPIDLIDAPTRKEALIALRHFMGDAIFVAHNAEFDFGFLNASFDRFGLGHIGNLKLCTIDLAKRTFKSPKYGLAYLIDELNIETATHHRALSDAICALKVMQKSFESLPKYVQSSDELLQFSVSSKKERGIKDRLEQKGVTKVS